MLQSEGAFGYEYHLKDHLGNLRVAFAAVNEDAFATFENDSLAEEHAAFGGIAVEGSNPLTHKPYVVPEPETGLASSGTRMVRLAGDNQQATFGPYRVVPVSSGMQVQASVYAATEPSSPFAGLADWSPGVDTYAHVLTIPGGELGGGSGTDVGVQFAVELGRLERDRPLAYLRLTWLDASGQELDAAAVIHQMGENWTSAGTWPYLTEGLAVAGEAPVGAAFAVVYIANESSQPVYFDDLYVQQTGLVVRQENHYYPFGLNIKALERTGSPSHLWQFQGQEKLADFGLGWAGFKWRFADPQLGRFMSLDPIAEDYYYNSTYAFSENKVVAHIELEGLEAADIKDLPPVPERKTGKGRRESPIYSRLTPNTLPVKRPSSAAQKQSYSALVKNSNMTKNNVFSKFLANPGELLSNSQAHFNQPVDGEGNSMNSLSEGSFIKIGLGPLELPVYVKVESVSIDEHALSASFVTLQGHVERGEITFTISSVNEEEGVFAFYINSSSETDFLLLNWLFEYPARKAQTWSWEEVIENFAIFVNGESIDTASHTEDDGDSSSNEENNN